MQNIQKSKEMLAQIGAACVQITMGCGEAQERLDSEELLPALQELEYALGELHTNAQKLRENAMSSTIDSALDHDGKTDPANEAPEPPPDFTEAEARKVLELVIYAEQSCIAVGLGQSAVGSFIAGYTARILGDEAVIEASSRRPRFPLPSGK
jgi:hypothetical protein